MNRRGRRRLREGRFDPFDSSASGDITTLLQYLNSQSDDDSDRAVRQLVTDMNAVSRIIRSQPFDYSFRRLQFRVAAELRRQGLYGRIGKRIRRIRDTFENFVICASPIFPYKSVWVFERLSPQNPLTLWLPLTAVHGLATEGLLERIRKCVTCGEWFYSYRPNARYKFHSEACRVRHWRRSPEVKKMKAKYMRQYRDKLKQRDNANLETSKTYSHKSK